LPGGDRRKTDRSDWLGTLLQGVADRGRELLKLGRHDRGRPAPAASEDPVSGLSSICHELLSQRGEASGTALAREALDRYAGLTVDGRLRFFLELAANFGPNAHAVDAAYRQWNDAQGAGSRRALMNAIEGERQRLFRRLNMAPRGTSALVEMRAHLLDVLAGEPRLEAVEDDLRHLLSSWFNRGFLEFQAIGWQTPAETLEKLIAYEAVHAIRGWDDLRRRLASDRRCYAFFHPALPGEPLIFVEVALVTGLSDAIAPIIEAPMPTAAASQPDTATFYSISNCQPGLRGISFGNFLIKQVAEELKRDRPELERFATLSPVPGFRRWVDAIDDGAFERALGPEVRAVHELAGTDDLAVARGCLVELADTEIVKPVVHRLLERLCAHYLCEKPSGQIDGVARFHLGNGARLERINVAADLSSKGRAQSFGLMVNYLYEPAEIEANHEAFVAGERIARADAIDLLLDRNALVAS
jgi:malonyl-CoA decarboxylase